MQVIRDTQPSVHVQDLGFSYGETEVLRDLTLSIGPREIFAIVGPNAAGKTTLLRCIQRILKPTAGTVYVDGRDISALTVRSLGTFLASVPQSHTPVFPYTVRDVVLMGRNPYLDSFHEPGPDDVAAAEKALEELSIQDLADRPYTDLSGGQLQLVLLARALAQQTGILLLDEPTAHLDFRNRHVVFQRIRRLADVRGLTVAMTVHDPNDAMLYADRVALVADGRVTAVGTPGAVLTAENLERLYGMKVDIVTDGRRRVIIAGDPDEE